MPPRVRYISIEGIVGSGKTTTLEGLPSVLSPSAIACLPEPVHAFAQYGNAHNPLTLSYDDPMRNAAVAQIHIMRESCKYYNEQLMDSGFTGKPIVISERSVLSPEAFIRAQWHAGVYTDFVRDFLLSELRETNATCIKPDAIIYLDVPPAQCLYRVLERNRSGEKGCDIVFLRGLQYGHQDMLSEMDIPIVKISPSYDMSPHEVCTQVAAAIQKTVADA